MFHDPDPLAGRFFNSKLFWVVIVLLVIVIVAAMVGIRRHRANASAKVVKAEQKAVVTDLPRELQGASSHLELAQRQKEPKPPDMSAELNRLREEVAMLRSERQVPMNGVPATPATAPVAQPAKTAKATPDPDAQRRKQEALEAERKRAQEEDEARKSPFAPIRHDKAEDQQAMSGLNPLRSKYTVFAGQIISLVMVPALNSESPDTCVARVTHDVSDGLTGDVVLIPRDSTISCTYSSAVFGQERLVPKANLLTLPNGDTMKLESLTIATASGQAGLDGEVDQHWGRIWASIPLSILRAGSQATAALGNDPASRAAGLIVQDTTQNTTQAARQSLLTKPTIRVDRSKIGVILLPKPLELRPYPGRS